MIDNIIKYNCQEEEKKNNKIQVFSIPFAIEVIFAIYLIFDHQNLLKYRKNITVHAGSVPSSCFGTGHVTDLSTPPQKREYV